MRFHGDQRQTWKQLARCQAQTSVARPCGAERCCVVLRVEGEAGVANVRACLLDTLRAQESAAQNPDLKVTAQERLGEALRARGEFMESNNLLANGQRFWTAGRAPLVSILPDRHAPTI